MAAAKRLTAGVLIDLRERSLHNDRSGHHATHRYPQKSAQKLHFITFKKLYVDPLDVGETSDCAPRGL